MCCILFEPEENITSHGKVNMVDQEVLSALHYNSLEEAGKDVIYLQAESKISEYGAEVARFQEKYGASLEDVEERVQQATDEEDFETEDDLMSWRFAKEKLQYWKTKLQELD